MFSRFSVDDTLYPSSHKLHVFPVYPGWQRHDPSNKQVEPLLLQLHSIGSTIVVQVFCPFSEEDTSNPSLQVLQLYPEYPVRQLHVPSFLEHEFVPFELHEHAAVRKFTGHIIIIRIIDTTNMHIIT